MPPRARAQSLSRRHRFTAQGSFGPVLRSGRKLRGDALVVHAVAGMAGPSRLGVALPRRHVRSSVERNRIKRIVREAFRRHPLKDLGIDCVVAARAGIDSVEASLLRRELGRLFDQLHQPGTR